MWLQLVNGRQGDLVSFNGGLVVHANEPRLWDKSPAKAGDWVYTSSIQEKATVKVAFQEEATVTDPFTSHLPISATAEEVAKYGDPTEAWDALFGERAEVVREGMRVEQAKNLALDAQYKAEAAVERAEAARKDQEACTASGLELGLWEFRKALRAWDRHYAYADDSRVWRAGKTEGERLRAQWNTLTTEQKAQLTAFDPEAVSFL